MKPPAPGGRRLGLVGFLIELALPTAISAALLWVLAGYIPFWDLHTEAGLWVFGSLLVVLSVFASIRIDLITLPRRRKAGTGLLLNRAGARSRLVKFILGGVAVPIAAFLAANRVELAGHQTAVSLALATRTVKPEPTRAQRLGDAVLRAESANAKVQGILALQALRSGEAMDQLFRILDADSAALRGGGEHGALSRALASYGSLAVPGLLRRFEAVGTAARQGAAAPSGDLYERSLAPAFSEVQAEIEARTPEPAARAATLERLRAVQAELKRSLGPIEADLLPAPGGSGLPAFIMETLLAMDPKQDAGVLAFAQRTAADTGWSDAVRGQAMLLVGRLGGKGDLTALYANLDDASPLMRARAMQAIALLEGRLSAAGTKE